jgi:F-type H+-transporting ATPase subunit delta
MSESTVADRYARAIFEIGAESGELERLVAQIGDMARTYAASPDLRAILENPLVAEQQRDALLAELASRLGLGEVARNSVRLLARRKKLRALPHVARRLGTMSDERAGVVRARVTTARELPEPFYAALEKKLEKATGKQVVLERKQDPALIAGIVTQIGDNTIDGSLLGRLHDLERQLLLTNA